MTYIVLGSEEEGLYWEVGCYSGGCYSEVLLYLPFLTFTIYTISKIFEHVFLCFFF